MTEPLTDPLHGSYRELISARLDGELDDLALARLATHLVGCPRCRQFDHDLVEQRRLMRALPPLMPPRDLWARTSAALDRELLRDAQHGRQTDATPRASGRLGELANPTSVPSLLMVSLSSVGLAVALLITQLGPTLRLPSAVIPGQPTPFGALGVALAFVGADAHGLTLYRTHVDDSCPATSDCDEEEAVAARVTFPANFQANNLALAPRGDRLAIMGSDSDSENVFAVFVVPPLDSSTAGSDFPNRPRGPNAQTATPAVVTPGPGSSVILVGQTAPPSLPAAGTSSTPVIPPEVTLSTILDGVYGVGSAPAWSPDGQALAFSAMPSDRGRGPDLYVWRVGDDRAQPITHDHGSYFSSWSGSVIVVSRAVREAGDELTASEPVVEAVGIDLATSEERVIDADGLWLPQVDPAGHRAVAWHGSLAWDGQQVVPIHGALYVIDWASIDPFAASGPQATPDGADIDRSGASDSVVGSDPATSTDGSPPTSTPAPTPTHRSPRAAIATDAPSPRPLDPRFTPIEPARDVLQHSVTDWRVIWSADGRLLGVWIGDIAGTAWGHLTVFSLDLQGVLDRATPILGSTLAKRGFNVGGNRVAWVAPLEGAPSGELRVRMWNDDGVRDMRVRPVESTGVVAAF